MLVIYYDDLLNHKDFLFESQCSYNLDYESNVYAYVIDANLNKILIRNVILTSIILIRCVKLETITKYNQTSYYLVMLNEHHKITNEWINNKLWKKYLIASFAIVTTIYVVIITSLHFIEAFFARVDVLIKISNIAIQEVSLSSLTSQIDVTLEYVLANRITIYEKNVFDLFAMINHYQNVFVNKKIIVVISKNE